ncbi:MAG: 16S rRNA (cytosine(1402)-N(4))-methyltransferase RsmH [Halanaerobiaceae bacterium]
MVEHQPVLLEETIDYIFKDDREIYLDGTLGRGGHTLALLKKLKKGGRIIAIDRDRKAVEAVRKKLGHREEVILVHDNFINIPKILGDLHIKTVAGMIFDLGFSSPQIDSAERGFSYRRDGPLDMRMNRSQSLTAADIVNNYSRKEIGKIIRTYGEENWAERIAEFIVKNRGRKKIETTRELVKIIKQAIPAGARRKGGHPARRTFQALRIATNDELNQLEEMLEKAVGCLAPGGRIAVISFHSLEDRIVKHRFRDLARKCSCPPDFPICVCDEEQVVKVLTGKPVRPDEEEVEQNPRARSAKLRVAERVLNHKAGE